MLKELENSMQSPKPIIKQLQEYKEFSWKALNSYAHGGLHPLSRTIAGYPVQLIVDVIRNSNAIVALVAQLASILTEDANSMAAVRTLHTDFSDCLPVLGSAVCAAEDRK